MTFLTMVSALVVLDLAGDATELLTVVFVAQFENLLLVFLGGGGRLDRGERSPRRPPWATSWARC